MSRVEKGLDRLGKFGLGLLGMGLIGTKFIFIVDGGERVVIFNLFKGLQEQVYGEGMHFMIPILHIPKRFIIRTRPYSVQSITGTRDLQQV